MRLVLLAVLGLGAGCAAIPDEAEIHRQIGAATASSSEKADTLIEEAATRLTLPVADHLSAVQYCALFARAAPTSKPEALSRLRDRSALRKVESGPSHEAVGAIPFGDLFPLVRSDLLFDREASAQLNGGRTFVASEDGICAVLTMADMQAPARTTAWLNLIASGWQEGRKSRGGWRVYQVRQPTPWESDLVLFEAPLSDEARKRGVTAAHLVGVRGLP